MTVAYKNSSLGVHSSVYKSGGKIPHRCIALLRYAFKHCEGLRGVDAEAFHDHAFRLADNVARSQRRFELVFPLLIDKRNRGMIGEQRTNGSRLDRERPVDRIKRRAPLRL